MPGTGQPQRRTLQGREREFATQVPQPLFVAIWKEEQLDDDWKEGVIVNIPGKHPCATAATGNCLSTARS